jgi:hypothetical protein
MEVKSYRRKRETYLCFPKMGGIKELGLSYLDKKGLKNFLPKEGNRKAAPVLIGHPFQLFL